MQNFDAVSHSCCLCLLLACLYFYIIVKILSLRDRMKGHQTYKTVEIIVLCHVLNPTHEDTVRVITSGLLQTLVMTAQTMISAIL